MSKSSVKDKLAKINEIVTEAKEDIDEEYATLVKAAKVTASKEFESAVSGLVTTSTKSYISSEDKDALLEDGKKAIEEATTLQGVFEVFDKTVTSVDKGDDKYYSEYKNLVTDQSTAINAIIGKVSSADMWLRPQSNSTYAYLQSIVLNALEDYGVTVNELPSTVAQKYVSKVLQSRSLEKNSKNEIVLQKEGVSAVEDAADGVKTALYNGILAKYKAEVSALKSCSEDVKTTLKSKLENAASSWKNAPIYDKDKDTSEGNTYSGETNLYNGTSSILEGYLGASFDGNYDLVYGYTFNTDSSYTAKDNTTKLKATSLLGTLENVLNDATDSNAEIKAERVSNVLAEYQAKWTAELAEVKAYDSDYVDAISTSKNTNGEYEVKESTLGKEDATTSNFALTDPANKTKDNDLTVVRNKGDGDYNGIYYSAEAQYEALVDGYEMNDSTWTKGKVDQCVSNPSSFATVTEAKKWAASNDGTISDSYRAFMSKLATELSSVVVNKFTTENSGDGTYVKQATIKETFESKIYNQYGEVIVKVGELENLAVNGYEGAEAFAALERGIKDFISSGMNTSKITDKGFTADYINEGYGEFYKATLSGSNEESVFSQILAGTMSKRDVTDFVTTSNLATLYKEDVLSYTQSTLANFHTATDALIFKDGSTALKVEKIRTAVSIVDSLFNDEKNCYDISSLVEYSSTDGSYVFTSAAKALNGFNELKALLGKLGFTVNDNKVKGDSSTSANKQASYTITKANDFAASSITEGSALKFVTAFIGE